MKYKIGDTFLVIYRSETCGSGYGDLKSVACNPGEIIRIVAYKKSNGCYVFSNNQLMVERVITAALTQINSDIYYWNQVDL